MSSLISTSYHWSSFVQTFHAEESNIPFPFDPTDLNITCRFAGVFHVEKNGRYSISRTEAEDLCQAFNSTLPTMEQMLKALDVGFETCR